MCIRAINNVDIQDQGLSDTEIKQLFSLFFYANIQKRHIKEDVDIKGILGDDYFHAISDDAIDAALTEIKSRIINKEYFVNQNNMREISIL